MKNKFALMFYYSFVYHLPNTKFCAIFNRFRVWYISKVLKIMLFHSETIFENGVYISDGKNVSIGMHCHINERVFIQGAKIGNFVMIAPDVSILNNTHSYSNLCIPMIKQELISDSNPVIEDDVLITENGPINLSANAPRSWEAIEELMKESSPLDQFLLPELEK